MLRRLLLACLCCLPPLAADAADFWGEPFVEAIDDQDAIVDDNVTALAEDSRGLLWIGTPTGLLRFDGYRFKPYRHQRDNPRSIGEGFVRNLAVAPDGRLWIGTNAAGVSILDTHTDTFEHLRAGGDTENSLPSDSIRGLAVDADGHVWIASNGGLARADSGTARITRYRLPTPPENAADIQVVTLALDNAGDLWIGTSRGLFRHDRRSDAIEPFALAAKLGLGQAEPWVLALMAASDGSLWVATVDATALRIDGDRKTITPLFLPDSEGDAPSRPRVPIKPLAMMQEGAHAVWLGGTGALVRCELAGTRCEAPRLHDPLVQAGFIQPDVRTMLRDRGGQLWLGGYGTALRRINVGNSALQMLRFRPGDPHGLGNPSISAIAVDDDGTLFLGSRGEGIDVLDPQRGVIARLPTALGGNQGANAGVVTALLRTRDRRLWAGTDFGLIEYPYPSPQGRRYLRGNGLPSDTIRRLLEDSRGRLWVGSNAGLAWLDREQGRFIEVQAPEGGPWRASINALAEGDDGRIWIGAVLGLFSVQPGQQRVQAADDAHATRPPASVLGLLYDRGTLWIDRTDGLQRLVDAPGATFEAISAPLGLEGEPFGANLLRDALGRIWTQRYLYDTDTRSLRELLRADGADLGTPWFRSYAQDRQGRLYFGGSRGVLRVNPDEYTPWTYEPPVVISELRIDGRPQPLPREDQAVIVTAAQQAVSVEFAALDYTAPQRLRYAYRLLGHDDDWIAADASHRIASYARLWPGDYRLRIRGSNRTGQWSPHEVELLIRVEPQLWQRPVFALAMLVLLGTALAVAMRLNARRLRQRARELQELVSERTAALANAKQRAESVMRELGDARSQLAASEKMASFGKLAQTLVDEVLAPLDDAIAATREVATRLHEAKSPSRGSASDESPARHTLVEAAHALNASERSLQRVSALLQDLKRQAPQ